MQTNQERLKFVVEFSQTNIGELRPGDLLNLRDDFRAFFYGQKGQAVGGPIGEIISPFAEPLPQNYTIRDFEALQKDVYPILNELVLGKDTGTAAEPFRELETVTFSAVSPMKNGRSVLMAQGSTRDMFLLRLFLLLSREPINRILRCKASDCERMFYRQRKQEFCSTKCTNREYMRGYRKDPGFSINTADERHERYTNRVRKAHGSEKKVMRRRRK